jgi:thymidylate synthase (FAD)
MRIIQQSVTWFNPPPANALEIIELAGRNCYKSEERITPDSVAKFVSTLLASQHESVIEHVAASLRIITDRGVSHELVRHRLASYSQESTRYANYSKDRFGNEITVIEPVYLRDKNESLWTEWYLAMVDAEQYYMNMLRMGATPQEARAVLPNSLKTELVMSANLREWKLILKQRCSPQAHPQMRALMLDALVMFRDAVPIIFDDLASLYLPKKE